MRTRLLRLLTLSNLILLLMLGGGEIAIAQSYGWVLQNPTWAPLCNGGTPLSFYWNCGANPGKEGRGTTLGSSPVWLSFPTVFNGFPKTANGYQVVFYAKNVDSATSECTMRSNLVVRYFGPGAGPDNTIHQEQPISVNDTDWTPFSYSFDSSGIGFDQIQLSLSASNPGAADSCSLVAIDEVQIIAQFLEPTPTPTPSPRSTATAVPTVCTYLDTPTPIATTCSTSDKGYIQDLGVAGLPANFDSNVTLHRDMSFVVQANNKQWLNFVHSAWSCNFDLNINTSNGVFHYITANLADMPDGTIVYSFDLRCSNNKGGPLNRVELVGITPAGTCTTPAPTQAPVQVCTTPQYIPTGTATASATSTPMTATMTVQANQTIDANATNSYTKTATSQAGPTVFVGTPCPACNLKSTATAQANATATANSNNQQATATANSGTASNNATMTATAANGNATATAGANATAGNNLTATANSGNATATATANSGNATATAGANATSGAVTVTPCTGYGPGGTSCNGWATPPKQCDNNRYAWFGTDSNNSSPHYITNPPWTDPNCPEGDGGFGGPVGICPVGYVPSDQNCWLSTPTPYVTAVPATPVPGSRDPAPGAEECCTPILLQYIGYLKFGFLDFDWLIYGLCAIYRAIISLSEMLGCWPHIFRLYWNEFWRVVDTYPGEYLNRLYYNWYGSSNGMVQWAFAGMAEILLVIGGKIAAAEYVAQTALTTSLTTTRIFFQVGWVEVEVIYNGLIVNMGNSWTYIPFYPLQVALRAFRVISLIWELLQSAPEWNAYNFNVDLHNLTQPVINMATDLRMAIYLMFEGIFEGLKSGWVSISNAFYNALAWALSFMPKTISIIDISTAIKNITIDLIYSAWLLANVFRVRIDDAISWLNNFMNWQLPSVNAIVQWLYHFDIRNFIADLADAMIDNLLYATSEMLARFRELFRLTSLILRVAVAQIASFTRWLSWWQQTPMTWLANLTNPLPSEALFLKAAQIIPQYISKLLNLITSMGNLWWYWFNYPYYIMIAFWSGIEAGFNVQGYTIIPVCTAHPDPWCAFYYGIWTLNAVASQTFLLPFFLVGMLVVTLYVLQKNVEELWNAL